eukprot:scaffold60199_cov49-Phaeocystis_antarctica.AAC.1
MARGRERVTGEEACGSRRPCAEGAKLRDIRGDGSRDLWRRLRLDWVVELYQDLRAVDSLTRRQSDHAGGRRRGPGLLRRGIADEGRRQPGERGGQEVPGQGWRRRNGEHRNGRLLTHRPSPSRIRLRLFGPLGEALQGKAVHGRGWRRRSTVATYRDGR